MTPNSIRRHQAVYRSIVALTPRRHRARHGDNQVTLFGDLLASGETPLSLWIGVMPDLLRVMAGYREDLSQHLARVGLAIVGLIPIGVGVVIGSIWLEEYGDVPAVFPATSAALILQGTFGASWLTRRADRWRSVADRLFVAGEVAALALGIVIVALAVTARSPNNPQTLRLLAGGVAGVHGMLGLTAFRLTRSADAESVTD
jgi:hypothetical protein